MTLTLNSTFRLFKSEVVDKYIRDNFQRLEDYVRNELFGQGRFKFMQFSINGAVTISLPHTLGYQPKDVIPLSISPDSVTAVWNTDDFTNDTLSVTVSGTCTVRALIGRYGDNS